MLVYLVEDGDRRPEPIGAGVYGKVYPMDAHWVRKHLAPLPRRHQDIGHATREIMAYSRLQAVGAKGSVSPLCSLVTVRSGWRVDLVLQRGVPLTARDFTADDAREVLRLYRAWSAAGLYHFDLKPDNFVRVHGQVRVVDWGLVRTDASRLQAMEPEFAFSPLYRHPDLTNLRVSPDAHPDDFAKYELWALCSVLQHMLVPGSENVIKPEARVAAIQTATPPLPADIADLLADVFQGKCTSRAGALHHDVFEAMHADVDKDVNPRTPVVLVPATAQKRAAVLGAMGDILEGLGMYGCVGGVLAIFDTWCALVSVPRAETMLAMAAAIVLCDGLVCDARLELEDIAAATGTKASTLLPYAQHMFAHNDFVGSLYDMIAGNGFVGAAKRCMYFGGYSTAEENGDEDAETTYTRAMNFVMRVYLDESVRSPFLPAASLVKRCYDILQGRGDGVPRGVFPSDVPLLVEYWSAAIDPFVTMHGPGSRSGSRSNHRSGSRSDHRSGFASS